ncbi:dihydrofolate reductase family protein [Paeniglutamicibacter sp. Y32M11]|uniref:dihydrofolate reductase family protein n=1 Tax=Paeniglutamicibacter sp. Y32M11 TaxID=2853258 RepID=UPI0010536A11|nr:dihydrofolate reductase family protein [Paeniglutamicibacter sp. Y32M11]QXQ11683.1 dihydrofolate reductase family protein [Paeniglutamicibacter sp. Y32M11]
MTRFRYFVAASTDGYIADENERLDWLMEFDGFEGQAESYDEFMNDIGAIAMGADTYSWMRTEMGDKWPYPGLPTWVYTHRELAPIPGADLTFVRGDVTEWAQDIARSAKGKDVWVVGGGSLAGQFVDEGLLDEVLLYSIPVLLGGGRPLVAMRGQAKLTPTYTREYAGGIRETRYTVNKSPGQTREY